MSRTRLSGTTTSGALPLRRCAWPLCIRARPLRLRALPLQVRIVVVGLITLALGACTSTPDAPAGPDLGLLLSRAQSALDEAPGVRLALTGEDLPTSGTVLVSAVGRAVHPDSFAGEVRLTFGGLAQTVPVVAIGDRLWAKLPLTPGFVSIDPASLGIRSPGHLIAADGGLSDLLTAREARPDSGQVRDTDGTLLTEVRLSIPGEAISAVLALEDPTADVSAAFGIDQATGRLHRAVFTGPFLPGGSQTYTLRISDYGEQAPISAPA